MGYWRRTGRTLLLAIYAVLPPAGQNAAAADIVGPVSVEPRQIRAGMGSFLDRRGELQLFFPECLAIAAPFLLFRLKREGFSDCTVGVSKEGLYLRCRR